MSDPELPADLAAALERLRSPATIRDRCQRILAHVAADRSPHFIVDPTRLEAAAARVAAVTRRRYPDLAVPYHSRWRHFEAGGIDRHLPLRRRLAERRPDDPGSVTRALLDLVVVSVLLDAGAGAAWRYREAVTGMEIGRSEGLALASLAAFEAGAFSSDHAQPCRVDAAALRRLTEADLARIFQVDEQANPLVGLAGRTRLMNALGAALAADPRRFGPDGRPGGLYDLLAPPGSKTVAASAILDALLQGLSSIWPSGQQLGGAALGDCWPHPAATPPDHDGADAGRVPFHKLSQWLTYSLLEPFEWAGIPVRDLACLTGLPEYRNGGLLLDSGVLVLRDPEVATRPQRVDSELVVEWRALTVALIDRLAERVRAELVSGGGAAAGALPLAAILEGGTWAAGRQLAAERRGGEPPLTIVSDGTVF